MAERHDPARDLVADLRRVDDAFAGLKTGRSDVVERLLAGDTNELVRQSARRHRRQQLQRAVTVVGAFALVLATVVAVRLMPGDRTGAIAEATTVPSTRVPSSVPSTTGPANPTTTHGAASVTNGPAPTPVVVAAPVTAPPPPTLRRLHTGHVTVEHDALATMGTTGLLPLTPAPSPSSLSTPEGGQALALDAIGVAAPVVVAPASIDDDSIDGALRTARRLAARGDFDGAVAALTVLLEQEPPVRIVDTVTLEQARLLSRAGRHDEACAALDAHRARFPASDNAVVVDAERARWSCP
jgi:hypothetical protein